MAVSLKTLLRNLRPDFFKLFTPQDVENLTACETCEHKCGEKKCATGLCGKCETCGRPKNILVEFYDEQKALHNVCRTCRKKLCGKPN